MAYNAQTLPGAHGTGLTEDSYETGRAHGLQQPTGLGNAQPQAGYGTGSGVGEVCDMPNVYNPTSPDAVKAVHHVQDDRRERTYEPVTVEETIVHHDVERIKPVLHQEVHQTRLHEVTHHKVAPVRDLGVVEVVHHRDTDECGHRLTTDVNAIHGTGHGAGGMLENLKDKITGQHTTHGTTGYNTTTTTTNDSYGTHGTTGAGSGGVLENIKDKITGQHTTHGTTGYNNTTGTDAYGTTGTDTYGSTGTTGSGGVLENIKDKITGQHTTHGTTGYNNTTGTDAYGTTGNTLTDTHKTDHVLVPATVTTVTDTTTGNSTGNNYGTHSGVTPATHTGTAVHDDKVGGIKGLINKVIPGPGPFKA